MPPTTFNGNQKQPLIYDLWFLLYQVYLAKSGVSTHSHHGSWMLAPIENGAEIEEAWVFEDDIPTMKTSRVMCCLTSH